jgi:hypothetical protein
MNRILVLFALVFLMLSCEKSELNNTSSAELPVIQAYLIPGELLEVSIFNQLPFETSNTASIPVDGLTPIVSVEGESYGLSQNSSGRYVAPPSLSIRSGASYLLSFEYKGVSVEARTDIPHKPEGFTKSLGALNLEDFPFASIDPIVLSWSNPDNEYYQVAIEYAESDTLELSLFANRNVEAGNQFSELPQQTNSYEIRPFSVSYVGTHRAILYRVNPEYALFAQEEGADSQTLAAPFTNVENGLGIFTGIATDTLLFEVRD